MSAARHADVLFVKKPPGKDSDLATYCAKEGIPHILFENFTQALPVVQSVVTGEKTKDEVLKKGKA
jgi:2-hydroxy-3-keto-5-methylthiopentenyl-1-phosphate phosphatase